MGCIKFVEKTFKSDEYQQILKDGLLSTIEEQYPEANTIFQQDLAPMHISRSTKKWLTERNIEILPWPANSHDLNLIENVWNDIKKDIMNEKVLPRNKAELKSVITRVWDNFSENTIDKLITSMPRRWEELSDKRAFQRSTESKYCLIIIQIIYGCLLYAKDLNCIFRSCLPFNPDNFFEK